MNKEALFKIAMAAYDDEMRKIALQSYLMDEEPITKEALAACSRIEKMLDAEELAELEKVSEEICSSFTKLAFWAALGRGARVAGEALAGWGGKTVARAAEPGKRFTRFLAGRRRSPEFIQKTWGEVQQAGGPLGFARSQAARRAAIRRMPQAEFAPLGAAPAAGGTAPVTTRGTTTPPPTNGKTPGWLGKAWPDIKSGALWGLGFAGLQRLTAPKQEPEYQIGY